MPRASKIDRLDPEFREAIGALRAAGHTLDEILAHVRAMGLPEGDLPSRSGLGRHIQGLDALAERVQRSRAISEAIVRRFGDAPESRQARLNIELMHAAVTEFVMTAENATDDDGPVMMNPKVLHDVSKALHHLVSAQKVDADMTLRVRKELLSEQQSKLEKMEREAAKGAAPGETKRGFDPETLRRVRQEIYGLPG